jgi:prepilin-type N-terminal cleavage/methylation domain-containing protein
MRGFTLIELLIVLTIILVLAGMLIGGAGYLRWQAKAMDTVKRMDAVQASLTALGGSGFSAGQVLHRDVIAPHLAGQSRNTGVFDIRVDSFGKRWYPKYNASGQPIAGQQVAAGDRWNANFPTTGLAQASGGSNPYVMINPWGLPGLDDTGAALAVVPMTLEDFQPSATTKLLLRASMIEAESDWGVPVSASGATKAWNDAWGHPLVVGYAIWRSRAVSLRRIMSNTQDSRNDLLDLALAKYGAVGEVYLAVGAVGPELRPGLTGNTSGVLITDQSQLPINLWAQVTDVCDAKAWTQEHRVSPKWQGVKTARKGAERCFLSAPLTLP